MQVRPDKWRERLSSFTDDEMLALQSVREMCTAAKELAAEEVIRDLCLNS